MPITIDVNGITVVFDDERLDPERLSPAERDLAIEAIRQTLRAQGILSPDRRGREERLRRCCWCGEIQQQLRMISGGRQVCDTCYFGADAPERYELQAQHLYEDARREYDPRPLRPERKLR